MLFFTLRRLGATYASVAAVTVPSDEIVDAGDDDGVIVGVTTASGTDALAGVFGAVAAAISVPLGRLDVTV